MDLAVGPDERFPLRVVGERADRLLDIRLREAGAKLFPEQPDLFKQRHDLRRAHGIVKMLLRKKENGSNLAKVNRGGQCLDLLTHDQSVVR